MSEDRAREVLDRTNAKRWSPAQRECAIRAMLMFASEREAIGCAAGREEMRERIIGDVSGAIPLPGNPRQVEGTRAQGMWDAVHIARAALPVDGGKDGADG